jgi:integrase
MNKKTTLEISVIRVLEELSKNGYCQSTILEIKKVYDRLLRTAFTMQENSLTHALAEHFINDSAHTRTGQYCHSRKKLHSSCIRRLREYEEAGSIGWKPYKESKVEKPGTPEFQALHTHYLMYLQAENKSKNTSESYRNVSCKFLIFIEKLGFTNLNSVPLELISKFFDVLTATWQAGSLRTAAAGLRSFLRYAEDDSRLLTVVPEKLLRKRTIIPVLTQEEEKAVWDVLQTDAVSTRDKAIMLLALLTGIRAVDILNLKLSDVDWRGDTINIFQQKTNKALVLPLLPAIGNTLVRYIMNDRPESNSPYVFLSCNAPHKPMKEHSACYAIVRKVFACAGVRPANELKGTRLLRHHVASKMLRKGVALQTISSTLGHVKPDSTDIYLTTDEENLRECASTLSIIPMKVRGLQ